MKAGGLAAMIKNRWNREAVYSTADYWDAKAREYDGTAVSMWPNRSLNAFYHKQQLKLIDDRFPNLTGTSVLDIGCGTGRMSRAMALRGADVYAIDFSAEAVAIAEQESTSSNPHYQTLSIYDLNERDQFAVAVVWGCLTVACTDRDDLSRALSRILNALQPGGKLLIVEPIHRGFLHRVLNLPIAQFLDVMRETGFTVEQVGAMHFWPMRLALAYFNWPRMLTAAGYRLGEAMLRLTPGTYFGDYKTILAQRPTVESQSSRAT